MDENLNQGDYSAASVSQILVQLIDVEPLYRAAEVQLEEFKRTGPPARSAVFAGVEDLADYNNQRAAYEKKLEQLERQYHERFQERSAAQLEVENILPPETSIVHEHQGKYYNIQRDGAGRLAVRPMSIDEYHRLRQRPPPF
jgi:hypothetical protein